MVEVAEEELSAKADGMEGGGGKALEHVNENDDSSAMSHTTQTPPYTAPPELRLTREEEGWIWDIVYWMECHGENEGLKKPTDYEFVLYALTTKGNTEEAIQRIRGIQLFREKYNVQDTVEEGMQAIQDFMRLHPGFYVYFDSMANISGEEGLEPGSVLVFDYSKNFDDMRGGLRTLMEGSAVSSENIDYGCAQQTFEEIFIHSPVNHKQMRLYNANFLFHTAFTIIRTFMSPQMRDALKLGCQIELAERRDGQSFNFLFPGAPRLTLPDIYLRPNYDVAMLRLLDKSRDLLEEFFYNVETFEF